MNERWQWHSGSLPLRRAVEDWYYRNPKSDHLARIIRESPHRRTARIDHPDAKLLVKHFRCGSHVRSSRERTKAAFGFHAGQRESRQQKSFARSGLPVADLLGEARTPDGDFILVLKWIEAPTLRDALQAGQYAPDWPLIAVAETIRQMHEAGFSHGDLHADNILLSASGPRLIDLHRSRRRRWGNRFRARDLGLLDYSLCELGVSPSDRLSVLQGCLANDGYPIPRRDRPSLRVVLSHAERTRTKLGRHRVRLGESPIKGEHWKASNF